MILIGGVALLAIGLAFPNVFSEREREESAWIPDQGLTLGLDLQGGVHWLLRIDDEKATRDELEATVGRVRDAADADGIGFSSIEAAPEGDRIVVRGAVEPSFREFIDSRFDTLEVDGGEGVLSLSLTEAWRRSVIERGVRQALDVLNRRIDDTGVREPIIAPQGEGRILVQLPGDIDPRRARELITRTTFLEFKKVIDAAPNEELLLARHPGGAPDDTQVVVSRSDGVVSEALLVESKAVLTGAMLEDARVSFDRRGRALVLFTWDSQGTEIFREFTAANIGQRMAAIIDGESVTAPTIQARIGRRGQIEGAFTQQEAADLAVALRSGALPIPLVIEEERTVGPALGADSIRNGLRSILVGGVGVLLFMGVYYRVAGMLANVALILNLVIIIGLMSFARATLTLPGIAGMVLTVGMAVDANVIIFERIREELRSGRPLRNAIQMGFARSRLTILDANITTMIAAVVLLYYGRGPVQGFGVTLAIGIFSSVFCALVVTRLLVDVATSRSERLRI
jgi:preprotein translocase subunit SecD